MNTFIRLTALLVVSLLALPAIAEDEATPASQTFDSRAAFEALKALEGTWVGTVDDGDGERETSVVWEVSAAGHSLIETFAPGTPFEMFSVYHLDGDELLMTHYCAIGNAPKMKFEASSVPGEISMAFAGGTNLDPERDAHAHEGTTRLIDKDHYESIAVGYSMGKPAGEQLFKMTRQP